MTAVLGVGFPLERFVDGQPHVPTYATAIGREELDGFVALVRDGLDRFGDVVVLYPDWAAEPTLRSLQTVRAALATPHLVGYPCTTSPLAGSVVLALAATLAASGMPAPRLLAALPQLEEQVVTAAWLPRLSGLASPAPTVLQHLVSLLPGTAFVVTSWPEAAIRRARGDELPPLPRAQAALGVALADAGGDVGWVERCVVAPLRPARVVRCAPSPHAASWWGCRRSVEAVLYPLDVAATGAHLVPAVPASVPAVPASVRAVPVVPAVPAVLAEAG